MASTKDKKALAKRTAGSGTGAAKGRKKKSTAAARSSTGSGRRVSKAKATQIGKEELRAMEVRRDIRLLVLLGAMIFVMASELGFCGVAGRQISNIMFGLFGITAYAVPAFVLFLVIFVISNLGRRTLPSRVTAMIALLLTAGAAFELYGGEPARATAYDAAGIFTRCAAARSGGGLLGGSIAYGLYRILGNVGAVLVMVLAALICVLILAQRSAVSAFRRAREERIERGEPSMIERRRERAARRRAEAAERRELAEIARREEEEHREEILGAQRQRRKKTSDPGDLMGRTLRPAYEEEEEDFGLDEESSLFARRNTKTRVRQPGSRPQARQNTEPTAQVQTVDVTPARETAPAAQDPSESASAVSAAKESGSFFENMHISIIPVKKEAQPVPADEEEVERVLRPDANTVRVESPGLYKADDDLYAGDPGVTAGATMKVFASGADISAQDDRLRFPFGEEEGGSSVRRIYEEDSIAPAYGSADGFGSDAVYDIADAGGMSTFNAQRKKDTAAASAVQEESVREAPVTAQTPARETQKAAQAPNKETPGTAQTPIDEAALSGIEVHRDRGGDSKAKAGSTAVSGRDKTPEGRRYVYPHFGLMEKGKGENTEETDRELKETAYRLQDTLRTFGVNVTITDISKGPSVTRYELLPEQGVKVSKIVSLADDIKLSLAAMDIRIEAPIPGKRAIGIEVPNRSPSVVALRDILESREFRNAKSKLSFAVGKDLSGKTIVTDIAKMPHMLIAGATGSGKSVCINTIIMSILFKASPQEVQLIMIDPKVVELSVYNGIPHLMIPVVTDAKKASAALGWATAEMDRRYKLFASTGVRDLHGYNDYVRRKGAQAGEDEKVLSRIVVIVDELADLMMVAKNDVEASICRLAQLARAAGIHLIIATQRPSVDVITGLIKANMPSRLAFAVTSQVDSRTILDMAGAEKLIGKGDMLFYPQSYPKPARIQGAFISDEDVQNVVDFIKSNNALDHGAHRDLDAEISNMATSGASQGDLPGDTGYDEHFVEAGRFIIEKNKASIGMLQRVFKIGFNRAARIMDQLAEAGVVSEENGTKARQVLMSMPQFEEYIQGMQ